MKYSAVIFDMDGTIVDTENIWIEATRRLIVYHGIEYTQEVHVHIRSNIQGMALHNSCYLIQQTFNLPVSIDDLIAQKVSLANELYAQEISYIEGFTRFITKVKTQLTQAVAIATNADNNIIHTTNSQLNLTQHFGSHIYGIESVGKRAKPNPDIYLYAADKLGIDPVHCIAIEDSAHGVSAAQAAGMLCIGINTAGNRSLLEKADIIINGYDEVDITQLS